MRIIPMRKAFSLRNNCSLKVIRWALFYHWVLTKNPFQLLSFGSWGLRSSPAVRAIPDALSWAIQRVPVGFMHTGFCAQLLPPFSNCVCMLERL